MISLVWTVSFLSNVGSFFLYEHEIYEDGATNCAPKFNRTEKAYIHFCYQIYLTAVMLIIPSILITGLYGYVIHSLRMGMKTDFINVAQIEASVVNGMSFLGCFAGFWYLIIFGILYEKI